MHQKKRKILGAFVGRDALGALDLQLSAPNLVSAQDLCLSEYGEIVHKEIEETKSHYSNLTIDNYIIMPNHIHMIVTAANGNVGAPGASRPTSALIPSVVSILKKKTNKSCGFDIWQTSYYDRIIRDETEYQRSWQYIDENPARWIEDEYYDK